MKKKILLRLGALLACLASHIVIYSWDPFSKDDWNSVVSSVNDAVISPVESAMKTAINKMDEYGKKIEGYWEIKRNIGHQLDDGADKLDGAPDLLQKQAVIGLQSAMIDGLNNTLIVTLLDKTTDLTAKRAQIAKFKKLVTDNQSTAASIGKGKLAQDLIDGFTAADDALAMIWSGPDLKAGAGIVQSTAAPVSQSAIGRLRHKITQEAKNLGTLSSEQYKNAIAQEIVDNKNSGILGELLYAGQTTVNQTSQLIKDIQSEIDDLKNKINSSTNVIDTRSLPKRMRDLANLLKA